jgi:hypothetical protein
MNHLEQLVSEWHEYRGYFVRRNVQVGPLPKGGYECELDVVAFHPGNNHLVHIEPSMDAHSWAKREERYSKKFDAGRRHIPSLFQGISLPNEVEQIALLGFASNANIKTLAGGRVMTASELFAEIVSDLSNKKVAKAAVPEQYPLLRTLQFACEHRHAAGWL